MASQTEIVVVARIRVQKGKEAEAEQAFRHQIEYVQREEQDTLAYSLHRARKDASTFLFYERYRDAAALDRHGKSTAMQELFQRLTGILDGPPVIEVFEELAGVKRV